MTVNDGIDDSNAFALLISVNPVNDAPEAINDNETVQQDSAATLINVLSNDTDIDGDTLIISDVSYSGNGTVSITDSQISYQPQTGFSGVDSLTYVASDGSLSSIATLNVTVTAAAPTTPTTPSSSGGGGAVSLFWVWLLGVISLMRNRQTRFPLC